MSQKNHPTGFCCDDRPVIWRPRQHDAMPATERQKQPGHEKQRDAPCEWDVAGTGLIRHCRIALQFGIKLDNGHRGLVPIRGVEIKMFTFHQAETLVTFAEAEVLDATGFARKIDADGPAIRRPLRQCQENHANISRPGGHLSFLLLRKMYRQKISQ